MDGPCDASSPELATISHIFTITDKMLTVATHHSANSPVCLPLNSARGCG